MRYERHFYGPGSIGDMPSGYGLSQPPTISSNDRPQQIPGMGGCMGCMGTNGEGNGNGRTIQASIGAAMPFLVPVAIGVAAYYLFVQR